MQGFSPRNLQFMRSFAEEFPDAVIVKQLASQLVVEYALRDLKKPIGVAGWETTFSKVLPAALAGSLPSVEELEAELGG